MGQWLKGRRVKQKWVKFTNRSVKSILGQMKKESIKSVVGQMEYIPIIVSSRIL